MTLKKATMTPTQPILKCHSLATPPTTLSELPRPRTTFRTKYSDIIGDVLTHGNWGHPSKNRLGKGEYAINDEESSRSDWLLHRRYHVAPSDLTILANEGSGHCQGDYFSLRIFTITRRSLSATIQDSLLLSTSTFYNSTLVKCEM